MSRTSTRFTLFNSLDCEIDSEITKFTEEEQDELKARLIAMISGNVINVGDYITVTEAYDDED